MKNKPTYYEWNVPIQRVNFKESHSFLRNKDLGIRTYSKYTTHIENSIGKYRNHIFTKPESRETGNCET